MEENILGKGENAGYQHFLLFTNCLQKFSSSGSLKVGILDLSKLKAFADNKINMTQKIYFVSVKEEDIVGKGENVGYQHFLLFPHFPRPLSWGSFNVGIACKE